MRSFVVFFASILVPVLLEASPLTDSLNIFKDPNLSVMGLNNGLGAGTRELPKDAEFLERTLVTPTEFAPSTELQMTSETFRRIQRAIIGTLDQQIDFVVLVSSDSEAQRITSDFGRLGGNTSRVKALNIRHNSFWYQDYGPIYSIDGDGKLVSNDFNYTRYNRYQDDASPEVLAGIQGVRNRKVTMNYEGGNFVADGKGTCFASHRIYDQNPQLRPAQVDDLMKASLGCQKMVILTPLVDDVTFHIDLFAKLVADNTFFVGDFPAGTENKELQDENARALEAMGYDVVRIPVLNPNSGNYLTHINTFLINGYALMPTYGIKEDKIAKAAYERAGYKVLEIDSRDLQNTGGAVHCILRSKPALQ